MSLPPRRSDLHNGSAIPGMRPAESYTASLLSSGSVVLDFHPISRICRQAGTHRDDLSLRDGGDLLATPAGAEHHAVAPSRRRVPAPETLLATAHVATRQNLHTALV